MPYQPFQILRCRGKQELFAHVLDSSQANPAQSDLILQLGKERFDLSSLLLLAQEGGVSGPLCGTLPYSLFHVYHQLLITANYTLGLSRTIAALSLSRPVDVASVRRLRILGKTIDAIERAVRGVMLAQWNIRNNSVSFKPSQKLSTPISCIGSNRLWNADPTFSG